MPTEDDISGSPQRRPKPSPTSIGNHRLKPSTLMLGYGFDPDKIWVTVLHSDDEAAARAVRVLTADGPDTELEVVHPDGVFEGLRQLHRKIRDEAQRMLRIIEDLALVLGPTLALPPRTALVTSARIAPGLSR